MNDTRASVDAFHALARRCTGGRPLDVAEAARAALSAGPSGTARAWFNAHDGARVDTLQAGHDEHGVLTSAWFPGARTVNASRATFVTFDGSRRDYAGTVVLGSTADALVLATGGQVVAYVVTMAGGRMYEI